MLGLGWPGGPFIEKLAKSGDPTTFPLPRPLLGRAGCDFSFSGLKTAVAQTISRLGPAITAQNRADIAASFQASVCAVLADRAQHALEMMPTASRLVAGGGVAANTPIRAALTAVAARCR